MKRNTILACLIVLLNTSVFSSILYVVNTNDNGTGSLRDAVNSAVAVDFVKFDPSLISGGSDTIYLTQPISISRAITIEGLYNTTDTLFISGSGTTRIFNAGFLGTVVFRSLVLINGYGGNSGAGAINVGYGYGCTCEIYNCIIKNCSTLDYSSGSAVSLIASYTSSYGTLKITDSEISSNSGGKAPVYCYGGGQAYVYIDGVTIANNINNNGAGGVYATTLVSSSNGFYDAKALVDIKRSTIAYNNSTSYGAVYAYSQGYSMGSPRASSSIVNITNSSIVANSVGSSNIIYSDIYTGYDKRITVAGSIIALNTAGSNFNAGVILTQGNSILSAISTSLNLGPLQKNGGFGRTMMPMPPSTAINMGDASDLSAAQNTTLLNGRRDIGAAEYISTCVITYSTINDTICQGASYLFNGVNRTSTGIYKDTLTNVSGCDSIITLNLTVSSLVSPSVFISSNQGTTICKATPITFSVIPTNGGSSPVYQWKKNGINVGSGLTSYSPTSLVNSDLLYCKLTSNVACPSNSTATSNSITMIVNSSPTISIATSNSLLCAGQSATLNVTGANTYS